MTRDEKIAAAFVLYNHSCDVAWNEYIKVRDYALTKLSKIRDVAIDDLEGSSVMSTYLELELKKIDDFPSPASLEGQLACSQRKPITECPYDVRYDYDNYCMWRLGWRRIDDALHKLGWLETRESWE